MAGGDKEGPVPSGGAGEPGPKPKDGNGLGFVVISQIEQNIPLSFSVMSQPSQGLGAVCQQIQTGRHTVLKGGTRPHPFGSLLLQPWRKWRKKQGWTEANGGTHAFSPGCRYTHCFSSSHPHSQRATPQGWMQRSLHSLHTHPC